MNDRVYARVRQLLPFFFFFFVSRSAKSRWIACRQMLIMFVPDFLSLIMLREMYKKHEAMKIHSAGRRCLLSYCYTLFTFRLAKNANTSTSGDSVSDRRPNLTESRLQGKPPNVCRSHRERKWPIVGFLSV